MTIPILVTGTAGRVGAVGRTVTELLLSQGKAVRAMVRNEDERAQALRDMGAEVVVGESADRNCQTYLVDFGVGPEFWRTIGTDRSTRGGRQRLMSGVLLRTSEARRFGGAERGSRVRGQHESKIEGRVARHDLRKASIGEHL